MKCGDRNVNLALTEIYGGFTFINSWFNWLIFTIFVNFYLNYCGLYLSDRGNRADIGRHIKRVLLCKTCRKKAKNIKPNKKITKNENE